MCGAMVLSVILETPRPFPKIIVIGGQHTAFPAGGHDFVLAKGEGSGITEASNRPVLISCTVRLSTIFDDPETMFASQLDDWIHVTRPSRQVDRNDRFRTWCQHFPDSTCGERLTDRIYVREYRLCSSHDGTAGRCDESAAGDDYLIACSNPQRIKRQFESHCSVCDGNCMLTARKRGKLVFELSNLLTRPVIEFSRPQDNARCFDFVFRQ